MGESSMPAGRIQRLSTAVRRAGVVQAEQHVVVAVALHDAGKEVDALIDGFCDGENDQHDAALRLQRPRQFARAARQRLIPEKRIALPGQRLQGAQPARAQGAILLANYHRQHA